MSVPVPPVNGGKNNFFFFLEQSDRATDEVLLLRKILYLWVKRQEAKDKSGFTQKKGAIWKQAVNREEPSPSAAAILSLIVKTQPESRVRARATKVTDRQSLQSCMI